MVDAPADLGFLRLQLPGSVLFLYLVLKDPLVPSSWTVVRRRTLAEQGLTDHAEASTFFTDVVDAYQAPAKSIFISISQEADGRHNFVNLGEAAALLKEGAETQLNLVSEKETKAAQAANDAVMLYAKVSVDDGAASAAAAEGAPQLPIPMVDEWCPHASIWATNYSVIPELSVGLTQRMILCDERTLCRQVPEEPIFEHLRLIVNCHESKIHPAKYKIGSCSTKDGPKVICQAVHRWFSLGAKDMNRVNDEMQQAMWQSLQTGTVAVHCLAGIHRAACIVACHFLWRHYALGHTQLPSDAHQIYNRLKVARPAVEPAYAHVLQNYEKYLKRRFAK